MPVKSLSFQDIFQGFSKPLTGIDCGLKCGPYNDYGIPVCCDINLVVPTAFRKEWHYLQSATDLWQLWKGSSSLEEKALSNEIQTGQVALQCLGHQACQRQFRTITCRSFPFYPYLDSRGKFLGLSYYREYREQCWIISNLSLVTQEFKKQFQWAYNKLFGIYPGTRKAYQEYSSYMRSIVIADNEPLILMDIKGRIFNINPSDGSKEEVSYLDLENFGPFGTMKTLVFPDELGEINPKMKNGK